MKKRGFSLIVALMLILQVFGGFSVYASSMPMIDLNKMEAITDTGLSFPTQNQVNAAEKVGKISDFVFTGDFTPSTVGNNGHIAFGLASTSEEGNPSNYSNDWKANAARVNFFANKITMANTASTEEVASSVGYATETKYNFYLSLNSTTKTMVAGVKLATSDEWTYITRELESVTAGYFVVRPSEVFGAWENATIYLPKEEMVMEDISKMEGVTDTGLSFPTQNQVNAAEKVGKVSDFVFTGDFTPSTVGNNGHIAFGIASESTEGNPTGYSDDWKANAARVNFFANRITMANTASTEEVANNIGYTVGTKYNFYLSLNSTTKTMVAGVKLATSDSWTYIQRELDNVTAGYLAVRPSEVFGAWENVTIYIPKTDMPMEDTSEMESVTDTGLVIPNQNNVVIAKNVGKVSDFVFTSDFTPTSVGTGTSHIAFGIASTSEEGNPSNYSNDWKANAARVNFYRDKIRIATTASDLEEVIPSDISFAVGNTYNIYLSLNSETKTMVAGLKLATSDEWVYVTRELNNITAGYLAVRPSEVFGTWENTTMYIPKVTMPFEDTSKMEAITDTGLTVANQNLVNVAEKVGKVSNFVFTSDFTVTQAALANSSGSSNHIAFGIASTTEEENPSGYSDDWKANAARVNFYRDSIKIATASKDVSVEIPSEMRMTTAGEKYNIYLSLNSKTKTMVAGLKLATSDEWTFVKMELDNITAGYLAVRPSEIFGTWENTTIYVPTDYIFDDEAMYTVNGNKIIASLNVTRNTNTAFDTAVLITAVYKISDGMYALDNIKATEQKSLVLEQEVPFTNEVDVPTLAEGESYTVRSFLWHSFNDITPITSAFDMLQ